MKVKAWRTDSSGFERTDSGSTESLITLAFARSGACVLLCMVSPVFRRTPIGTGLPVWSSRVSLSVGAGD
jgi:hypothetical protein